MFAASEDLWQVLVATEIHRADRHRRPRRDRLQHRPVLLEVGIFVGQLVLGPQVEKLGAEQANTGSTIAPRHFDFARALEIDMQRDRVAIRGNDGVFALLSQRRPAIQIGRPLSGVPALGGLVSVSMSVPRALR